MPSMVEVVIPISSPIPEICVIEATKLSAEIVRLIDRVENVWDGPGGPTGLRDAIQNIIGLARSNIVMWLDSIEETTARSGLDAGVPSQSPSNVVASVGNANSNNPVAYTADRISRKIKERLSKLFSSPGKGGIGKSVPQARLILDLIIQRVKNQYGCESGIAHTNVAS